MKPHEFIRNVWAQQGMGYGFICLRDKDIAGPGSWHDYPIHFPVQKLIVPDAREGDIYFTPNLFSKPRRNKNFMLPSRWLYADLDRVDPFDVKEEWEPAVAWESSPGRYQGLWLLPRPLPAPIHQKINKQLTYAIQADQSGWDATQVLRVPDTTNYKYPNLPTVRLLYFTEEILRKIALPKMPFAIKPEEVHYNFQYDEVRHNPRAVLRKYKDEIPRGVIFKLLRKTATGDRSKVLFRLECTLIEYGLELEEVFSLIRPSVWNKFDNDQDLVADIFRVRAYLGRKI